MRLIQRFNASAVSIHPKINATNSQTDLQQTNNIPSIFLSFERRPRSPFPKLIVPDLVNLPLWRIIRDEEREKGENWVPPIRRRNNVLPISRRINAELTSPPLDRPFPRVTTSRRAYRASRDGGGVEGRDSCTRPRGSRTFPIDKTDW